MLPDYQKSITISTDSDKLFFFFVELHVILNIDIL